MSQSLVNRELPVDWPTPILRTSNAWLPPFSFPPVSSFRYGQIGWKSTVSSTYISSSTHSLLSVDTNRVSSFVFENQAVKQASGIYSFVREALWPEKFNSSRILSGSLNIFLILARKESMKRYFAENRRRKNGKVYLARTRQCAERNITLDGYPSSSFFHRGRETDEGKKNGVEKSIWRRREKKQANYTGVHYASLTNRESLSVLVQTPATIVQGRSTRSKGKRVKYFLTSASIVVEHLAAKMNGWGFEIRIADKRPFSFLMLQFSGNFVR